MQNRVFERIGAGGGHRKRTSIEAHIHPVRNRQDSVCFMTTFSPKRASVMRRSRCPNSDVGGRTRALGLPRGGPPGITVWFVGGGFPPWTPPPPPRGGEGGGAVFSIPRPIKLASKDDTRLTCVSGPLVPPPPGLAPPPPPHSG